MTEDSDKTTAEEISDQISQLTSRRDVLKSGAVATAAGLGLTAGAGGAAASGDKSDDENDDEHDAQKALTPKKKFEESGEDRFLLLPNPEDGKFPDERPVKCGGTKEIYHVYQIFFLGLESDQPATESYLLVPEGTDVQTRRIYTFAGEPQECEGDEKGKFEFVRVDYHLAGQDDGEEMEEEEEEETEEEEAESAEVEFLNQQYGGSKVTVQEVFLPQPGFVAIHDLTLVCGGLDPVDSVIGATDLLEAGEHENVEVPLFESVPGAEFDQDELNSTQVLIAMPHKSTNDNETYDFVQSGGEKDVPFVRAGTPVIDSAFVVVQE